MLSIEALLKNGNKGSSSLLALNVLRSPKSHFTTHLSSLCSTHLAHVTDDVIHAHDIITSGHCRSRIPNKSPTQSVPVCSTLPQCEMLLHVVLHQLQKFLFSPLSDHV